MDAVFHRLDDPVVDFDVFRGLCQTTMAILGHMILASLILVPVLTPNALAS